MEPSAVPTTGGTTPPDRQAPTGGGEDAGLWSGGTTPPPPPPGGETTPLGGTPSTGGGTYARFSASVSAVCRLALLTVIDTLEVEEEILKSAKTDKALDAYLLGDEFSNYQLVNALYPELSAEFESKPIQDYFDVLEVDIESLKSYILWIATEAKLLTLEKKQQALRQAKIILGVASVMNGNYLQRRKPSEFGRMYYEGVSVQNINKELRRAVLGDCWEYDIRSSVVAWKMGWAKSYIDSRGQGENLRRVFSATLGFLEDKADFMETVRYFTFEEDSPVPKDLQPKLLKQAFTAISFGARVSSVGWRHSRATTNPEIGLCNFNYVPVR